MGDTNINMVKVLDGVTLAATENATQADASRTIVDVYNKTKLNLSCTYTTGGAETSNTAVIYVLGYDGTQWIKIATNANSSGTITATTSHFDIAGASAATAYTAHFNDINIAWQKIKVTATESGVASNFGTLTVVALAQ